MKCRVKPALISGFRWLEEKCGLGSLLPSFCISMSSLYASVSVIPENKI